MGGGVFGYSLKDTMLTATARVATSLHLSQQLTGHQSHHPTTLYTRLTSIEDILKVTSMLVVPGIDSRFGDYNQQQLISRLE